MARSSGRRKEGMTPFKAVVLTIVLIAVLSYFGFTKTNPFTDPYVLRLDPDHPEDSIVMVRPWLKE